ncbi:MAG: ribonuclease PH [Candidatus Firestonebacteria bacterium]|nr:ribonuclease PH [Candidatus Firestonebacteria bacterium]
MRADGRGPRELRPLQITRNYLKGVEGAVLIETGDTKVLCTATVQEDVPPFLRGKGQGWVTAEYGMLPRCSPQRIPREAGKGKSGRTQEIQRLIGRSLRAVTDMVKLGERTLLLDCDVIQADGGTRTAAVTGAFMAMVDACRGLQQKQLLTALPFADYVAAVSVGQLQGELLLDLAYTEDSRADVDMNVIMTGSSRLIEVQGTAEKEPFSRDELNAMLDLAQSGIASLIQAQKNAVGDIFK